QSEAATVIALFHSNISFSSPGFVLRESNAANQRHDNIFHQLGDPGQVPSSFGKNQGRLFILSLRTCGPAFKAAAVQGLRREDMKRDKVSTAASPNRRALFRHGMELRVRAVQHHGCQTDVGLAKPAAAAGETDSPGEFHSLLPTRGSLGCALSHQRHKGVE
ncbi:hypothetical protein KUCAC02_018691, partial [Chaenocephalus aceratus]